MADCLFCRIVQRALPAQIVAEDDATLAFTDIKPQAPTHVLVVPKTHIPNVAALTETTVSALDRSVLMANRLAAQLGIAKRGYRLVINCGPDGGQTVDHLHVHMLGGRSMTWPPG